MSGVTDSRKMAAILPVEMADDMAVVRAYCRHVAEEHGATFDESKPITTRELLAPVIRVPEWGDPPDLMRVEWYAFP